MAKKKRSEQDSFPFDNAPRDEEFEKLVRVYAALRDERIRLNQEEKEAKAAYKGYARAKKIRAYMHHGVKVVPETEPEPEIEFKVTVYTPSAEEDARDAQPVGDGVMAPVPIEEPPVDDQAPNPQLRCDNCNCPLKDHREDGDGPCNNCAADAVPCLFFAFPKSPDDLVAEAQPEEPATPIGTAMECTDIAPLDPMDDAEGDPEPLAEEERGVRDDEGNLLIT